MAAIGPFCACPSRLCMSLGRLAVEPTAWFLRTRIASSSLSRRSSIRDWSGHGDWGVKGWGESGKRRRTEQLSLSILGLKLKTLIAWCGLKKQKNTLETNDNKGSSNAISRQPFQLEVKKPTNSLWWNLDKKLMTASWSGNKTTTWQYGNKVIK